MNNSYTSNNTKFPLRTQYRHVRLFFWCSGLLEFGYGRWVIPLRLHTIARQVQVRPHKSTLIAEKYDRALASTCSIFVSSLLLPYQKFPSRPEQENETVQQVPFWKFYYYHDVRDLGPAAARLGPNELPWFQLWVRRRGLLHHAVLIICIRAVMLVSSARMCACSFSESFMDTDT